MNSAGRPRSRAGRWRSRFYAVSFGFLVLLAIEGACRLLPWGNEDPFSDPFVGFSRLEPLFALNPYTNRYEIRPERSDYFVPTGFPRKKARGCYRIFVFGGSTVQGRPYSIETAFPRWLEINLRLAFPERRFEVINCGGVSYAGYRLVPVIRECFEYEPDLLVLCTGQNEFLEARSYNLRKRWAKPLGPAVTAVRSLAAYRVLDVLYRRLDPPSSPRPVLKMEVDALLDYRRGIEAYHRDPEWRDGVITHFRDNIRRIHAIAARSGLPLVVLVPPHNLKDCPPFKSEPDPALTESRLAALNACLTAAHPLLRSRPAEAASFLESAIAIDPGYAHAHFLLGLARLAQGRIPEARDAFHRALDEDVCPLRILSPMRRHLLDYCRRHHLPRIDLQSVLLAYSDSPILGSCWLTISTRPFADTNASPRRWRICSSANSWVGPAAIPFFPSAMQLIENTWTPSTRSISPAPSSGSPISRPGPADAPKGLPSNGISPSPPGSGIPFPPRCREPACRLGKEKNSTRGLLALWGCGGFVAPVAKIFKTVKVRTGTRPIGRNRMPGLVGADIGSFSGEIAVDSGDDGRGIDGR